MYHFGVSHSGLRRMGKFYLLHLGLTSLSGSEPSRAHCKSLWAHSLSGAKTLWKPPSWSQSGILGLHLVLSFVCGTIFVVCLCVYISACVGWLRHLWSLTTPGYPSLLHWLFLWQRTGWEFPFLGPGNCDPERPAILHCIGLLFVHE